MTALTPAQLAAATWTKSSHSQGGGECVEIATVDHCTGIRDSKDTNRQAIVVTNNAFRALIDHITR